MFVVKISAADTESLTLGPANVWVGVKNGSSAGTMFDLRAEVLKNGIPIGSGQLNGVSGGSSFHNAVLRTIELVLPFPACVSPGDTLSFTLSVRVAVGVAGLVQWYRPPTIFCRALPLFPLARRGGEEALLLALEAESGRELARYRETDPPTAAISGLFASKAGERVAILVDAGDHTEVKILDAATLRPQAEVDLPLGSGAIADFSQDGAWFPVSWSTPDGPGELFAVEAASGRARPLRREPRPTLARLPAIETSIAETRAFDGGRIPLLVYLPAGAGGRKLPVVVSYHGGPAGVSRARWSTTVRFFTALGYAVVEPNVRGSGGFGRAFEMADNGRLRPNALRDV